MKPFDQAELLARVASLARIKRYQDTIRQQSEELAQWNTELENRVARQLEELERARAEARAAEEKKIKALVKKAFG